MNAPEDPPLPRMGSAVTSACRGFIVLDDDTPSTVYRERRIYFCLPSCLKAFQDDPKTSCMAGDPLLELKG